MNLTLPSEILRRAEVTSAEARLVLAVQLYADGRIDHADACELAGIPAKVLNRELGRRSISVVVYPSPKKESIRWAG